MSFRCECCGRATPPGAKQYLREVNLGTKEVPVFKPSPVKPHRLNLQTVELMLHTTSVVTHQKVCDVCNEGSKMGMPDDILKKMKGRPRSNSPLGKQIAALRAPQVVAPPPRRRKPQPLKRV